MELSNDFRVGVPVSDAWSVLTDVERIAPHLPGAQLQEIEGDDYRGVVKVKVGPITAQYKGTATFVEKDEANGRVVLRCAGRDTRGQGNANATITAVMKPDGDGTRVTVTTDLTVTGKVAQFGRGVLADVSAKLMGQFADALEADLREHGTGPGAGAGAQDATPADPAGDPGRPNDSASPNGSAPVEPASVGAREASAAVGAPATAGTTGSPTTEIPAVSPAAPAGPRQVSQPEAAPVDLLDAAGGSVAKRLLPVLGAGFLLALVVLLLRRRGQRS